MRKILLSMIASVLSIAAFSQCQNLFISEYVEGNYNNKAVEIYNPTNAAINLSGYRIVRYSNGGTSPQFLALAGTLASSEVYVIVIDKRDPSATGYDTIVFAELIAHADTFMSGAYPGPMYFNGNDAITLETTSGTYVDIIGVVGQNPGQAWTSDTAAGFTDALGGRWWTKDHTLIRKPTVQQGITTNPTYFNPVVEWDSLPKNTFSTLGWHKGNCTPNSINNIKKQNNAFFFPNPVAGSFFTVKATQIIESVEITNAIGQVIYSKKNADFSGDMKIETTNMLNGIYMVKIFFTDNSSIIKKVIIE